MQVVCTDWKISICSSSISCCGGKAKGTFIIIHVGGGVFVVVVLVAVVVLISNVNAVGLLFLLLFGIIGY